MDKQRIMRGACAAAMAAILVLPAVAHAVPDRPGDRDERVRSFKKAREQRIRLRVEHALRLRKARFDRAAAVIGKRQDRIASIAERVEAKGGDVTQVESLLEKAETSLSEAKAAEQRAADAFSAVPGAEQPRAAFKEARGMAREALAHLKTARARTREAAVALVQVTRQLRGTESTGTVTP